MPSRKNFPSYVERRKKAALERQEAYSKLSIEEKMKGAGKKEKLKLEKAVPKKTE